MLNRLIAAISTPRTHQPQEEPKADNSWPEGTIARYLTLAGAALADGDITVDLSQAGHKAQCRGCGDNQGNSFDYPVRQWALAHAASCRAMPRPPASR